MARRVHAAVRAAIGVVAATALLSGCWMQIGFGPEHRNFNDSEDTLTVDNVGSLTEVWSVEIPGTATEPIVSEGRVFVTRSGSGSVGVRALDGGTGATQWDRELLPPDNANVSGVPAALYGGQVHVGWAGFFFRSHCGAASAVLDRSSGSIVSQSTNGVLRSPPVKAGRFFVQTMLQFADQNSFCANGSVFLTVRDDGSPSAGQWMALVPGTAGAFTPMESLPTIADGHVYVAVGTTVSAYALSGCGAAECQPLWSVDVAGLAGTTPIAGEDGQVFVATTAGDAIALHGDTGAELWRTSPSAGSSTARMALANGTLYVAEPFDGSNGNILRGFDAAGCGQPVCNGRSLPNPPPPTVMTSSPVVAGGVVYLGLSGYVVAYASDCTSFLCPELARVPFDGDAVALSVAQGKLFVAGTGHVAAYAAAET
jgi:outer membrane protein assembly factor BamB